MLYHIPIKNVKAVLDQYLDNYNFDPVKVFKDGYGYNEKESALVLPAFVTPDWNFATTINSITAISDNLVEIEIGCIEGYLQTVKTDPTFKMKLTIKVIDNGYHFVSFIKTYGEVRF